MVPSLGCGEKLSSFRVLFVYVMISAVSGDGLWLFPPSQACLPSFLTSFMKLSLVRAFLSVCAEEKRVMSVFSCNLF